MMKSIFTLMVFVCYSCITSHAQSTSDTIYYDASWKVIPSKARMAYYRVVNKDGDLYMVADYFKNGQLQMTGSYKSLQPEVQQGQFKYYDEKGKLSIERNFVNDQMDGDYKKYYPSCKLLWQIHYKKGINDGLFLVFYENGITRRKDIYSNGKFINGTCYTEDGKETLFFPYEELPEFVGGDDSLARYFDTHINYLTPVDENNSSIVYVSFFIGEDGSVRNAKVAKSGGEVFDKMALEAVSTMPPWKPGKQDGKAVKMPVTLPIRFGK